VRHGGEQNGLLAGKELRFWWWFGDPIGWFEKAT
jgi:hypothetical protein